MRADGLLCCPTDVAAPTPGPGATPIPACSAKSDGIPDLDQVDNPDEIVALKVLRNQHCDERNEKARRIMELFLHEGEMGMALRHPNIVPIYEVHSRTKPYFLVMEFIEGNTLRDFMKLRRRLSPLEATELMTGIMSGLAHAAQKGLNHRDLKLSNVLMSSMRTPKLVDFGLAAETGGSRR